MPPPVPAATWLSGPIWIVGELITARSGGGSELGVGRTFAASGRLSLLLLLLVAQQQVAIGASQMGRLAAARWPLDARNRLLRPISDPQFVISALRLVSGPRPSSLEMEMSEAQSRRIIQPAVDSTTTCCQFRSEPAPLGRCWLGLIISPGPEILSRQLQRGPSASTSGRAPITRAAPSNKWPCITGPPVDHPEPSHPPPNSTPLHSTRPSGSGRRADRPHARRSRRPSNGPRRPGEPPEGFRARARAESLGNGRPK